MSFPVRLAPDVEAWLEHEPDSARRRALIAWIGAASLDPAAVASYAWAREGRRVWAADIHTHGLIVLFTYSLAPVRFVTVICLLDIG